MSKVKLNTNSQISAGGIVRLAVYVVSVLLGTISVVAIHLGHDAEASLLGTIAGAGAAISGGTAMLNLEKAPDQKRDGVKLDELLPNILEVIGAVSTYNRQKTGSGSTPPEAERETKNPSLPTVPEEESQGSHSSGITIDEIRERLNAGR